jgi:taurine dioxygenase
MDAKHSNGSPSQATADSQPSAYLNGARAAVRVTQVAGHIGAEVDGVDLREPLSQAAVAAIRAALVAHKVLFFRDQRLDHREHLAFAERFGAPTRRPGDQHGCSPEGFPQILTVDPDANDARYGRDFEERYRARWSSYTAGWHTDLTPAVNPPAASVLRAEVVPDVGGDTQWTNLVAAYNGLAEPLKAFVDGLRAEHRFFAGCDLSQHDLEDRKVLDTDRERGLVAVHPVVRVHPETGERALFVNPASTARIVGFTPTESRHILALLFEQATRPEYTVRFQWAPGSVAFWDNRATAHLGATDLGHIDAARTLYRVTLLGDRPTGADGFVSEAVVGEPLQRFAP